MENASSFHQAYSIIKNCVSCLFCSHIQYGKLTARNKVDLAADLGIPNVPRGEPGSTKGIKFILNLETKKSEELLGLNPTTPLKDVVAESAVDFKARGYPGFTA